MFEKLATGVIVGIAVITNWDEIKKAWAAYERWAGVSTAEVRARRALPYANPALERQFELYRRELFDALRAFERGEA